MSHHPFFDTTSWHDFLFAHPLRKLLSPFFSPFFLAVSLVIFVTGCASFHESPTAPTSSSASGITVQADGTRVWNRGQARWIQTDWSALPGWTKDKTHEVWPALWSSCQRPHADWRTVCQRVQTLGPHWGKQVDENTVQAFFQANVSPWRVETNEGSSVGLLTGYFEPFIDAQRTPSPHFRTPLYQPPADLALRQPYYTRAEMETFAPAMAALQGLALAYVADPLDALLIQVQGSTRLRLLDDLSPEGEPRVVRLAFAGHNGQPYGSVARWLVNQGALTLEKASWPAIKKWAAQNPQRVTEMLHSNPRVVFFKEEVITDPNIGPKGAQGIALTPERAIAVDKNTMPYGTLVWIDSTSPQPWQAGHTSTPIPLQRLVVAQDTGSAIVGAVRADYFWGWGDHALAKAGRTKQPLRMWILWPQE